MERPIIKDDKTTDVILDTNMWLTPGQYGIDIFREVDRIVPGHYRLCILDGTIGEIEKLMRTEKGKDKAAAKLGLSLIKAKDIYMITSEQPQYDVDSAILETVKTDLQIRGKDKRTIIVATQDIGLRNRLKPFGIPIIVLRQKTHLQIVNV